MSVIDTLNNLLGRTGTDADRARELIDQALQLGTDGNYNQAHLTVEAAKVFATLSTIPPRK
ncbi:hypothetical protein OG871_39900 (plasmid) [Kitasatospora sp. NBC_00374]|uniref:hypothetical protein n=1 Tax=Kitasatospora sp. NBC_00374 TaxID=2975964 RepID=UPI002F912921